jgi:hypothetical protein
MGTGVRAVLLLQRGATAAHGNSEAQDDPPAASTRCTDPDPATVGDRSSKRKCAEAAQAGSRLPSLRAATRRAGVPAGRPRGRGPARTIRF